MVSRLRQYLDDVAGAQLVFQLRNASIYLRSHARVAYLRVNVVGKIDGRSFPRQDDDLALRGEGINLFGVEIDLEGGKEFVGVGNLALPLDHLSQPRQALLVTRRDR